MFTAGTYQGLVFICRAILGVIFAASSLAKLRNPYLFLENVYDYEIFGPSSGLAVGIIVPVLEGVVACCLLSGALLPGCFLLSATLAASFVAVQATAIYRGLGISCGCFGGAGGTPINYSTLLTSGAIFCLAFFGLLLVTRRDGGQDGLIN